MSNEEQQSKNSTQDGHTLDTVGGTMSGLEGTMGAVYSALENAASRNAQMVETMISTMEQIFRAKLKIGCTLKPVGNGMIDMSVIIDNKTDFPIVSMTGSIKFETNEIEIMYKDNSLFDNHSYNLAQQTQHVQLIHIKPLQPMHCNGEMILSFPHPMTTKPLEFKRQFALYVIDQLDKKMVDKSNLNKLEKMVYPTQVIREFLEIHPADGINIGMCIELSSINCKIVCEIIQFSEDRKMVQVEFSGDSMDLVSNIITELNKLSQV